jgi:hypothetical protein
MEWDVAIRRNREALLHVVAILFVMAGLKEDALSPSARSNRPPLPQFFIRPVRNSILRVLRPAESALRRLIVIAARGVVVAVPPARKAKHASRPNGQPLVVLHISTSALPALQGPASDEPRTTLARSLRAGQTIPFPTASRPSSSSIRSSVTAASAMRRPRRASVRSMPTGRCPSIMRFARTAGKIRAVTRRRPAGPRDLPAAFGGARRARRYRRRGTAAGPLAGAARPGACQRREIPSAQADAAQARPSARPPQAPPLRRRRGAGGMPGPGGLFGPAPALRG